MVQEGVECRDEVVVVTSRVTSERSVALHACPAVDAVLRLALRVETARAQQDAVEREHLGARLTREAVLERLFLDSLVFSLSRRRSLSVQ